MKDDCVWPVIQKFPLLGSVFKARCTVEFQRTFSIEGPVFGTVVTLTVFVPFALFYLKEPFKLDCLWGGFVHGMRSVLYFSLYLKSGDHIRRSGG